MTLIRYHSTLIQDASDTHPPPFRSLAGPAETTSSQILLSRGVSDLTEPIRPQANTEAPRHNVVSIFESPTHHIMTLGWPGHSDGVHSRKLIVHFAPDILAIS